MHFMRPIQEAQRALEALHAAVRPTSKIIDISLHKKTQLTCWKAPVDLEFSNYFRPEIDDPGSVGPVCKTKWDP